LQEAILKKAQEVSGWRNSYDLFSSLKCHL